MNIEQIPLTDISESPLNPRTEFDSKAIEGLAADMREHGVLQPVLVRKTEKGPELVFGHRRFRAAKLAGLGFIPATVTDLGDAEVLETQLAENGSRVDLAPLEMAEGLRNLREVHKVSVDDIAARLGRSKASIYAALKLTELGDPAKDLLRDGKLSPSTALLVARIEDPEKQEKAARHIAKGKDGEPLSYREAIDTLPKGIDIEQKSSEDAAEEKAARDIERKKLARAKVVRAAAVAEMVAHVEAREVDKKLLALMASAFDSLSIEETLWRRCKHSETKDGELRSENEQRYLSKVPSMTKEQLLGFVFECTVEPAFHTVAGGSTGAFKAACEFFGVDLKAIEKEVKLAEKAAKEPAASPFFPSDAEPHANGVEKVKRAVKALARKSKAT